MLSHYRAFRDGSVKQYTEGAMRKYQLTLFFVILVPFMTASAIDRIPESGWSRVWGVAEAALAVAITIGAAKEVKDGWKRRRTSA